MKTSDTNSVLDIIHGRGSVISREARTAIDEKNKSIVKQVMADTTVATTTQMMLNVFGNMETRGCIHNYGYISTYISPELAARVINSWVPRDDDTDLPLVISLATGFGYIWNDTEAMKPYRDDGTLNAANVDLDVCLRASKMKPNTYLQMKSNLRAVLETSKTNDDIVVAVRALIAVLMADNENLSSTSW